MTADPIDELCALAGIERVYHDQFGTRRVVSEDTVRALTRTLGLGGDWETATARHVAGLAPMEPVAVIRSGGPAAIAVALEERQAAATLQWRLVQEHGASRTGSCRFDDLPLLESIYAGATRWERRQLMVGDALPEGYHRLSLDVSADTPQASDAALISVPQKAHMPAALETGRAWGIAVQLYALRSAQDWGIGDFGSLATLVEHAAAVGVDAVGLNPLHALHPDEPERASPYSPSSRVHLNPLYIDVPSVPDFRESPEAEALAQSSQFGALLAALRANPLVDYAGVAAAKLRVLELLHRSFRTRHIARNTTRAREFLEFRRAGGERLRRFAVFQALREHRARLDPGQRDWRNWPTSLREPDSTFVEAFAREHSERVEYFTYLQWEAARQFAACGEAARRAGMSIGLYTDLAVGVDPAGGDAWARQEIFAPGWSLGAPPDNWNPQGQDWGLAPLNPRALRQEGYVSFIDTLRANMRNAGALRIDHVLGLWRSFWIRRGTGAGAGAYLRYPFADLVGVVALESRRAHCLVIGEDLGTVPEGLRGALDAAGILSCRVMMFERDHAGRFRSPQDYPARALVTFSTHDLPTLPGYWRGTDIELRSSLGLLGGTESLSLARARRKTDLDELAGALRREGLIGDGTPPEAPVQAVYRFLARTPGRLMMIQLEDALGVIDQVNVPGTIDEHPNWRRRLPLTVETIFADERVIDLCRAVSRERAAGASR